MPTASIAQQIQTARKKRRAWSRERVEDQVQKAILGYLRATLPPGAAANLHHARNEGALPSERIRSAALGTKAGWPDLEWFGRMEDGTHYSAMIEVKAPGEEPESHQLDCQDDLMAAGVLVGVATSIDEARELIRSWGIPSNDSLIVRREA
jgi:hypothetical protein